MDRDQDAQNPDAELDARGLLCPLPVLRARKRLLAMAPGAVLRVLADDPAARIDMPHFCAEAGHELLADLAFEGSARIYLIRRSADAGQPVPRQR